MRARTCGAKKGEGKGRLEANCNCQAGDREPLAAEVATVMSRNKLPELRGRSKDRNTTDTDGGRRESRLKCTTSGLRYQGDAVYSSRKGTGGVAGLWGKMVNLI